MKRKGFTLAELLGVIVIMSIILVLVAIPMAKHIQDGKNTVYESQIKMIKLGAEKWISDNLDSLPINEGETVTITVGTLKQDGDLEKDLVDPTTGECIPNNTQIKITKRNNKYDIVVDIDSGTDECPEIEEDTPLIYLNGEALEYVEFGSTWVDKGASAKTSMGVPITNVTSKVTRNGPTVDTNQFKEYEITYSATNKGITVSVIRTVIIIDTTPPRLTVPGDLDISSDVTSVNVMDGVSAIDNADGNLTSRIKVTGSVTPGVLGEYIITYEVEDSHGNKTTATRKIRIKDITSPTAEAIIQGSPFNSNNWAKANFEVKIKVNDIGGSGPAGFKYCQTIESTCTPTNYVSKEAQDIPVTINSTSNKICAIAIDNAGNEGGAQCFGPYSLDKKKPEVNSYTDTITITQFDSVNVWDGISVSDNFTPTSELETTTTGSVNNNVPGEYEITYKVIDKADNVLEFKRKYIVNPKMYTVDVSSVINGTVYGDGLDGFTFNVYRSDTDAWEYNLIDWNQSIAWGTTIIVQANEVTGYTYDGGDHDASITANVDIRPTWSVNYHTVYYNVKGSQWDTKSVAYGATIDTSLSPQSTLGEMEQFNGWNDNPGTMPDNDVTLTADISEQTCGVRTGHSTFYRVDAFRDIFAEAGFTGAVTLQCDGVACGTEYYYVETQHNLTRTQADVAVNYIWNHTSASGDHALNWIYLSCDNGYGYSLSR